MITRLSVANYRSIGERVELDLGRMTALVGPNGAGKSNLADALRFVAGKRSRPRLLVRGRGGRDARLLA